MSGFDVESVNNRARAEGTPDGESVNDIVGIVTFRLLI